MPALRLPLPRLTLSAPASSVRWAGRFLASVAGYWAAAEFSVAIAPLAPYPTALWLAAGVSLAILLRWGMRLWPALFMAALLVELGHGFTLPAALGAAGCRTIGPLAAAWALKRLGAHPSLDRQQDIWHFGLLAAGAGALLSASLGVGWLVVSGVVPQTRWTTAWAHWWVGDALGVLLMGVPLLATTRRAFLDAMGGWNWLLTLIFAATALITQWLAFSSTGFLGGDRSPLIFVPCLLVWALSARRGLFVASATALGVCAIAFAATANGRGPFAQTEVAHSVALLFGYACSFCAVPLLTGAVISQARAQDARWHRMLEGAGLAVAQWDVLHGLLEMSTGWLNMLGHVQQTFGTSPAEFEQQLHEEDRASWHEALARIRHRPFAQASLRMQCHDGGWKWIECHVTVCERGDDGAPTQIVVTARDVDQIHAAEERHKLTSKLFQHLPEGLLITDASHRVLDANPAFSELTGYPRDELIGAVAPMLRPAPTGSAAERQQQAMRESLRATGAWHGEVSEHRRDGSACTMRVTISAVAAANGDIRYHALALADVTEAHAQRALLERQAHTDELTGLPNRVRLAQLLDEALRASEREGFLLTVCYLDLDHFKPVNDRHGHQAGDRLLVDLAERLRRSLRHWASGDDVLARLGGDEFVLLLRTATLEEGRHAVERVLRMLSQPYGLGVGAGPVSVTASIGATVYPIDRADADTLLRHADHAMYGAKQAGRNGYLFFDAEHDRRTELHFEAMGRVQDALEAGQFTLFYQPKIDMRRARVLGVEALLRWKHPQLGTIAPAHFLPLIEHTGLSARLGDWVLQQGVDQLAKWQRLGLDLTVSINVSARHLQEPQFAKRLAGLLASHATPVGHRLIIEVLETAALADVDYTCTLMQECRAMGVRFALDDFGTGYSTFTYLKQLPLDFLKIDRSFVHNMLSDRQDLAIVEGVIGLSETFGCKVVAEGVETGDQAQRLIELGCDIGQGNGIAEAMPSERVVEWVRGFRNPFPAADWVDTV